MTKGLLVPEGSLGVFSFLQLQTADLTADFSPGAVEQKAVKEGSFFAVPQTVIADA